MKKITLLLYILIATFTIPVFAVDFTPQSKLWLRLNDDMTQIKLAPKGRYLAFISKTTDELKVLNLKNRKVYLITRQHSGPSFFWSPDGFRLFYREIGKSKGQTKSLLKSYDCAYHKSVLLEEFPYATGFLTFDNRDLKMSLLYKGGIHSKRISFPDSRLARWQLAQKTDLGRWVVSQNGVLWTSDNGHVLRRMKDTGSSVESFDISPDGLSIAWATKDGFIYTSYKGKKSTKVDAGRDPSWHPIRPILLYAGARLVGKKISGYDLKIRKKDGRKLWLTRTQYSNERWPQWSKERQEILFTKNKTTDLYVMDFTL